MPEDEVRFMGLSDQNETGGGETDNMAQSVAEILKRILPANNQANREGVVKTAGVFLGDGLTPVPVKLSAKILKGEFVEMVELLLELSIARQGGEEVAKQAKAKKRGEDINVWLQCFAAMVSVVSIKNPEQVPELMAYMTNIIRASQEFEGPAWVAYDSAYRRQAAATGHTKWSKINASLYSLCFTGKAKRGGRCDHCLSAAHKSEDCSMWGEEDPDSKKRMKAMESAVISLSTGPARQGGQPGGRNLPIGQKPHQQSQICRLFNAGRCTFRFCRYRHVCQVCEGGHPSRDCQMKVRRDEQQLTATGGPMRRPQQNNQAANGPY